MESAEGAQRRRPRSRGEAADSGGGWGAEARRSVRLGAPTEGKSDFGERKKHSKKRMARVDGKI